MPKIGNLTVSRQGYGGMGLSSTYGAADDAESAKTRYRTLAEVPGAALVELNPETGRMHQLRAHLASIGRPIAGDVRYGGALTLGGKPAPRLMLHAAALSFPHPAGETLRLEARPPDDFQTLAHDLGLKLP